MQQKLQAAKNAFICKDFAEAKVLTLEIIESNRYEHNHKLYAKLGDICTELKEYENAHRYYQQSIDAQKENATAKIFIKLGNLLQYYLNDMIESKSMYDKALELEPNNDQCLFNYANLMEHQNDDQKAKRLYMKCLIINDQISCVNYRLAKLLMKENNPNNNNNIKKLLQKAVSLKPSNTRYAQELDLYLQSKSNHTTHSHSDQSNNNEKVKMVIYEFESIITYWNLWKTTQGNIEELAALRSKDINNVFGGHDRIDRFRLHFNRIRHFSKDIKIVILSYTPSNIMISALKRVKLYGYFDEIICIGNTKINDIIQMKDKYKLFRPNKTLYIDILEAKTECISNECRTYFVDFKKSKPFLGFTPDDFRCIEDIIAQKPFNQPPKIVYDPNKSLTKLNRELYKGMLREIFNNQDHSKQPIDSLACMKFARKQASSNREYNRFIEFGKKFAIVVRNQKYEDWWSAGHILKELLSFEQGEPGLWRLYAKALSYLRHNEDAENAYDRAIKLAPTGYRTWLSYSHHLLSNKKYHRAKDAFRKTMEIDDNKKHNKNKPKSWTLCIGLARTLQQLNENEEAEHYFKLAVSSNMQRGNRQFYETGMCFFGIIYIYM